MLVLETVLSHLKDFVSEVEASISYLPDETRDQIRTSAAANIFLRDFLPNQNISKEDSKAFHADKGNCLVVLDREEYDSKMESLDHCGLKYL